MCPVGPSVCGRLHVMSIRGVDWKHVSSCSRWSGIVTLHVLVRERSAEGPGPCCCWGHSSGWFLLRDRWSQPAERRWCSLSHERSPRTPCVSTGFIVSVKSGEGSVWRGTMSMSNTCHASVPQPCSRRRWKCPTSKWVDKQLCWSEERDFNSGQKIRARSSINS